MANCIFCKFISGDKTYHRGNLPYKPIHETKNTVSFLSIDFPANEDGHVLVIPKDHYKSLEDIPPKLNKELLQHVQLIAKATRKNHSACNILLNNGKNAGQEIFHVHFHIVPRDKDDKITIENWRRKKVSPKKFEEIYDKVKSAISN